MENQWKGKKVNEEWMTLFHDFIMIVIFRLAGYCLVTENRAWWERARAPLPRLLYLSQLMMVKLAAAFADQPMIMQTAGWAELFATRHTNSGVARCDLLSDFTLDTGLGLGFRDSGYLLLLRQLAPVAGYRSRGMVIQCPFHVAVPPFGFRIP